MTTMLNWLNGVLFTGGGASLDNGAPYFVAAQSIFSYANTVNSQGDYFPLWGTCMGFQTLVRCQSDNPNILTGFDSENITLPLNYTKYI